MMLPIQHGWFWTFCCQEEREKLPKEMCAKLVESCPKILEATTDAKCIFMKNKKWDQIFWTFTRYVCTINRTKKITKANVFFFFGEGEEDCSCQWNNFHSFFMASQTLFDWSFHLSLMLFSKLTTIKHLHWAQQWDNCLYDFTTPDVEVFHSS